MAPQSNSTNVDQQSTVMQRHPQISSEDNEKPSETRKEILCDGWYYDVTDFIDKHPGGIVINYYLKPGEDATTAIQQFHHRSAKKVTGMMKSFKRRPAEEIPQGNPEVAKRNKMLTEDFTKLYLELEREGMFKPSYAHIVYRIVELFGMAILGLYLASSPSISVYAFACVILGVAGGRAGWLMHEAGHYSFTGNPKVDRVWQTIFIGLGTGMSATWWRRRHNRHHAMPQRVKHDVDLYTMPLLAQSSKLLDNPKQGHTFFVRNQKYLFAPLYTFLGGLAWILYLNPKYVLKHRVYSEIFCISMHFYVASLYGVWTWLIAVWIGTVYLFFNFALSHAHLPVTTEPSHWVEYGLSHTVDIEHTWWCDWWMGYLNYQIEHHLFPAMPQFRQRLIAPRVKALADKHGIPYRVLSYKEACYETLKTFGDVADEIQKME